MPFLTLALLLVIPQIWGVFRRKSAAFRVGLLAGCVALVVAIRLLVTQLMPAPYATPTAGSLFPPDPSFGMYDTMVQAGYLLTIALSLFVLSPLLWAAARFQNPFPRMTRIALPLLVLATFLMLSRPLYMATYLTPPNRYVDYESWAATVKGVSDAINLLYVASWLTLALLSGNILFHSLINRLRR